MSYLLLNNPQRLEAQERHFIMQVEPVLVVFPNWLHQKGQGSLLLLLIFLFFFSFSLPPPPPFVLLSVHPSASGLAQAAAALFVCSLGELWCSFKISCCFGNSPFRHGASLASLIYLVL